MKILQLAKFYPPDLGGIEAVARDLSDGFVRHGLQVEVLCASKRWRQVDEVDAKGVRVTRAASLGLLLSTSMAPLLPWLLLRRRSSYDVVHVHMPDPLAALAVWFARPAGRLVVHWHSDVVRQRFARHFYRPLEQWLLARADAVIATSPPYVESSEPLVRWRAKTTVVPIGTHAPEPPEALLVERTRRRYGGRRIVFALGRMVYYKGWEVLIEAARRLPDDVLVVVAGGGPLLAQYRSLSERAGAAARIRFVGQLSARRVEAHFAASEVFCMASTVRAEAYGIAVLEAMARGKPVVSTDIPGSGLGWLQQHGVTGLGVPVRDPVALADALIRLLGDAELRARFGAAGLARWAAHFTADTMADRTVALYRQLLGTQRAVPPSETP